MHVSVCNPSMMGGSFFFVCIKSSCALMGEIDSKERNNFRERGGLHSKNNGSSKGRSMQRLKQNARYASDKLYLIKKSSMTT